MSVSSDKLQLERATIVSLRESIALPKHEVLDDLIK